MAEPRVLNTKYPVSASVQVVPGPYNGSTFVVASRAVWVTAATGGQLYKVLEGDRPFASTACQVKAGVPPVLVAGCDDGALYSTKKGGKIVETKLDIYSSPVFFASQGAGEGNRLAFGSDDGGVWCVDEEGASIPGFPVPCGAFVSATPAVCDFDGDGRPEILVGDWAGKFHALRLDGSELPGFPIDVGWPVWSSAAVADLDGDGQLEAVVATRYLHAIKRDGTRAPGFPRLLGTYAVGSPIVVDLQGDGRASAVVGADKLYAFDGAGNALAGFPKDLGAYLWASPVSASRGGREVLFVAAWDGRLYEVGPEGAPAVIVETQGPIFGAAGVARAGRGGSRIAVGSWDGRLYIVDRPDLEVSEGSWPVFHRAPTNERASNARFAPPSSPPAPADPAPAGAPPAFGLVRLRPAKPRHRKATFVDFEAEGAEHLARAQLIYAVGGEDRRHPSPVVMAGGRLTSLVQPLGVGRVVRFHLEGQTFDGKRVRHPAEGEEQYVVKTIGGLPIGGLIARLEGKK